MARTTATLQKGVRLTDFISLGVITKLFPKTEILRALEDTGKTTKRHRNLPSHVLVYYVIALALYMEVSCREVLRCLLEGCRYLQEEDLIVTGRAGISQARKRLGSQPVKLLYERLVTPQAIRTKQEETRGAWYQKWRVVSIDGSTLDVADTQENAEIFGRPGASRGQSSYPQIRFVSLVENGTHILFHTEMAGYNISENVLSVPLLEKLNEAMLCLADRNFYSYTSWKQAHDTGSALLWRVKKNMRLPCLEKLPDGSYLSKVYPNEKSRRHDLESIRVRVIEYTLSDAPGAEPIYRLITNVLDTEEAVAEELATLYHDRWEIENAFDEFKTHLRGGQIVLRSKKAELVRQEFYGLLLAHFAIRGLMHEAALKGGEDPDRLSFTHSIRVIRRRLPLAVAFSPS